tara:strand:- start:8229 stop:8765 length:537 start_codon:yes stop_codon:yes gene_type:complete
MKCNCCGSKIPNNRFKLGYKLCIECSDVEKYSSINIINHKTGNTIQIVDKETAKSVNSKDRKGFSIPVGMRGGSKNQTYNPKNIQNGGASRSYVGSEQGFKNVGKKLMFKYDLLGYNKALEYLARAKADLEVNGLQASKLRSVLNALHGKVAKESVSTYADGEINPEIKEVFRTWKTW